MMNSIFDMNQFIIEDKIKQFFEPSKGFHSSNTKYIGKNRILKSIEEFS